MKTKLVAFMHCATLNHYQYIVNDTLLKSVNSGLLNDLEFFQINVVGDGDVDLSIVKDKQLRDKIKITRKGNLEDYDMATIKLVDEFSKKCNDEYYVLFCQTLSVSSYNWDIPGYKDRRDLHLYFTIEKYKHCISSLQNYDTCGANWNKEIPQNQKYPQHYSGNIWWARSSYLKTLPPYEWIVKEENWVLDMRHNAEFWIGMSESTNHRCFYSWSHNNDRNGGDRLNRTEYEGILK